MRSRFRALAILASVGLLAACTSPSVDLGRQTPTTSQSAPSDNGAQSPKALLAIGSAVSSDFEPARSVDELEALSEIVISGEVVGVANGPIAGRPDDDFGDIQLVIVTVGQVKVVRGSLPQESDGNVYLSIVAPMGADAVGEALPPGTPVALFGAQIMNTKSDGDIPLTNAAAGRPDGQPVFVAAHPQGLVFQIGDGDGATLVWPQSQHSEKGVLSEALPGGHRVGFNTQDPPTQ